MNVKPAELKGKVWGIVGFGHIGRALAQRLKPFELNRVYYHDIHRPDLSIEKEFGVVFAEMAVVLSQSDIISLHAPLTEQTRAMINEAAFKAMKPGACLINVARAELVDEKALAEALKKGIIAGAGIDVFSQEPVTTDNPLLGVDNEKLLFSPHSAGVTDEGAGRIINMAAANIARVLKGDEPESPVN